jgi:DNA repair protein RadC
MTSFDMSVFADIDESPSEMSDADKSRALLGSLRRDDIVTVGKSRWRVENARASVVYLVKAGTSGRKLYGLDAADLMGNFHVFEVFPGSGKSMGLPPAATGLLVRHPAERLDNPEWLRTDSTRRSVGDDPTSMLIAVSAKGRRWLFQTVGYWRGTSADNALVRFTFWSIVERYVDREDKMFAFYKARKYKTHKAALLESGNVGWREPTAEEIEVFERAIQELGPNNDIQARMNNPVACGPAALPLATQHDADASAADVVIVAESDEGFSAMMPRQSNPLEYSASPVVKAHRRSKKWSVASAADEATNLYDGHEGLLIRTAMIRPPTYRESDSPIVQHTRHVVSLVGHLKHADQEHMVVLSINSQNRVVAIYEVAVGPRSSATVEMRDIIKTVILSGGAGVIFVHNHPSGNPTPSQADIETTKTVKAALACVGCQLLDHVIVAANGYTSFFETGMLSGMT